MSNEDKIDSPLSPMKVIKENLQEEEGSPTKIKNENDGIGQSPGPGKNVKFLSHMSSNTTPLF